MGNLLSSAPVAAAAVFLVFVVLPIIGGIVDSIGGSL